MTLGRWLDLWAACSSFAKWALMCTQCEAQAQWVLSILSHRALQFSPLHSRQVRAWSLSGLSPGSSGHSSASRTCKSWVGAKAGAGEKGWWKISGKIGSPSSRAFQGPTPSAPSLQSLSCTYVGWPRMVSAPVGCSGLVEGSCVTGQLWGQSRTTVKDIPK